MKMRWLTVNDIKNHCRIDFENDDKVLEFYGKGAEDTILYLCNRTYENLVGTYGKVPDAIIHATLELVDNSYNHRSPASPSNLSVVPYNFDLLLKEYIVLSGTPLLNERDRIVNAIGSSRANLDFFAASEESETKQELYTRINTLLKSYEAVTDPTPMILDHMRDTLKKLEDDVNDYLKSLHE